MTDTLIFTATERRPEIAELWAAAIRATFLDSHTTVIAHQLSPPTVGDMVVSVPQMYGHSIHQHMVEHVVPQHGLRIYIEEDIIPVRPWSASDYPGDNLLLDMSEDMARYHHQSLETAAKGVPWRGMMIRRKFAQYALIPQRFVRDSGCPDWLPPELCEPAKAADATVVGNHFLHLDKMYVKNHVSREAKEHLFHLLRGRFATTLTQNELPTAWDAAALPQTQAPKAAGPEMSFVQKAANFAASAARHIAAGAPQASEEEVARRFAICETCEHFDGKACRQCGCPVVREKKFLSKLSWANEKCPVGKW